MIIMITQFRFFDKEPWSIYATLQTIIVLGILKFGFNIFTLKILVLSSLISMMQGNLLPRLIFAFFMSLLVWEPEQFILGSFLTVLAALITYFIPYNNVIHRLFIDNKILNYILKASIVIWFIIILVLLYKKN